MVSVRGGRAGCLYNLAALATTLAIDNVGDLIVLKHIHPILEKDALVRDWMDTRRVQAIRKGVQRAEAKRLQRHYIQAFFMEAFQRLGGQTSEREKNRFEMTRVPASIHNRDRQTGRGAPVLMRYERVTIE